MKTGTIRECQGCKRDPKFKCTTEQLEACERNWEKQQIEAGEMEHGFYVNPA